MNDTVMKLLSLADEHAAARYEQGYARVYTNGDVIGTRQALQDELVRLFTPLTDDTTCNETQQVNLSSTVLANLVAVLTGTQSMMITTSTATSVKHLSPATERILRQLELELFFNEGQRP